MYQNLKSFAYQRCDFNSIKLHLVIISASALVKNVIVCKLSCSVKLKLPGNINIQSYADTGRSSNFNYSDQYKVVQ